ncbi:hypothetical protein Q2T76_01615 [Lactobacillus sp. YT155]|uniref:hypothetical protein n=1 Tax=Lactobacillus sp. YT155 TaxID=3060955 RepID=UPI00265D6FCE|nr:hypothetical protein [Lactobacillus sp. YT155]MDO1604749.1 hypothetical protein [Lactobacillus sp. YT155]
MLRTPIETPLGTVKLTLNGQPLDYSSDELKIADRYIEQMDTRMVGTKYFKDIKKNDEIVLTLDEEIGNFEFDGDEGYYGSIGIKDGTKIGISVMEDPIIWEEKYGIDGFGNGLILPALEDFSAYIIFLVVWGDENLDDIEFTENMYI